jgi:hypothetical protein
LRADQTPGPLEVLLRTIVIESLLQPLFLDDDPAQVSLYLHVIEDYRIVILLRILAGALSTGQQQRAHVYELLYLLGALLGGLANSDAAQAVPHEHNGLGLRIERIDDAIGIALQRDFHSGGPVLTVSRQIKPHDLVTGLL